MWFLGMAHMAAYKRNTPSRGLSSSFLRQYLITSSPGTDLEKEYYSKGIFPISASRSFKFPEAESLDEVALRAQTAVRQIVVPHLLGGGGHIGIASHGILIREFLEALNRLDPEYVQDPNAGALFTSGLVNSGWTRICLVPKVS